MDTSRLLKPAGVAVLSVLVGILASIGNEVVLVSLLVVLTGILVIWKQNEVPISKISKSTKNKHLNEKNVYSKSFEAQKQETLLNRKNKQSKGKNAYLDNSEVQKKENFSKMESKQPKESSQKLMLEVRMSGMKGSTGTTADNDNDWPKLGSRFNKNSTDFPILGSNSSCSFCGTKTYSPYKMISCDHELCRSCTTAFFSQLILTADITDCVCPICHKPEFHSQEDFFNYFIDFRKNFSYIFDAGMQQLLERKFQDYIDNMNGDYGTCNEVVTEASSKTESNVQAQPEVTYPQVPSTSKENNVGAASAPEKACSDCKELPDNSNIFVGKMKEADARCEDGPEPATDVSSYSFETINMDQTCDICHFMVPNEKVTKIFGCHHNFCVDCIRINFIRFTSYKMSKYLSCPVCHRPDLFESKTRALTYLFDLSIFVNKILNQDQYHKFREVLQQIVDLEFIKQGSDGTNNNL